MFSLKRFSVPLLIACSVLMFASGFLLLFSLSPLPDDRLWLVIFPCILWIAAFLPLDHAVKRHNRRFIDSQNALMDACFPLSVLRTCQREHIRSLFLKQGFRDNGHGYLRRRIFSLREFNRRRQTFTYYIRWVDDPSEDVYSLLTREYRDLSCLYDSASLDKRLILFVQRTEISAEDTENLNRFCMELLRDEVNLLHAHLPVSGNEILPRVKIKDQVYRTGHMILPVLTDEGGKGCFVDASALTSPRMFRFCCTYADCCHYLGRTLSD